MTTPLDLTPPPVAREDVQDGLRVSKRYRHRLGTLVCVTRCADQWPVLLVCWDDEPEYVSRVTNYDVTLWLEPEVTP